MIPQLAVHGQYAGTVSLAVRKAQALDPEEAALQPGADGEAARQVGSPGTACSGSLQERDLGH